MVSPHTTAKSRALRVTTVALLFNARNAKILRSDANALPPKIIKALRCLQIIGEQLDDACHDEVGYGMREAMTRDAMRR